MYDTNISVHRTHIPTCTLITSPLEAAHRHAQAEMEESATIQLAAQVP